MPSPTFTALACDLLWPQIAKWYVKVGDEIAAGTVLADIETDKATLAFENQEDGFIAAIVKPEGAKDVPVGETVAIVVEDEADVAAFAGYSGGDAAAAAAAPAAAAPAAAEAPAAAAAPAAAGSLPDHIVSTAAWLMLGKQDVVQQQEYALHCRLVAFAKVLCVLSQQLLLRFVCLPSGWTLCHW
jgi:pyruvate/2-oxoglutarate dehydrogenase complex dihydrolipoamide acyltransferase (E2) component